MISILKLNGRKVSDWDAVYIRIDVRRDDLGPYAFGFNHITHPDDLPKSSRLMSDRQYIANARRWFQINRLPPADDNAVC